MNLQTPLLRALKSGVLASLLAIALLDWAQGADNASAPAVTNTMINPATPAVTNEAPDKSKHSLSITTDSDDDENSASDGKSPSTSITIGGKHDGGDTSFDGLAEIIIPFAGIVATFGTPILIVFFICYFKYKRRRENLALVREYLAKGLPVPPQLLDESQRDTMAKSPDAATQGSYDFRKGIRLTFIGLAVTLALYVNWPHSTMWGWGLIPMVIGLGFLISGVLQQRHERAMGTTPVNSPASNEPPR